MIIIVNGILGVGKSTTAQLLTERLENSVYLQGDDYSEFEEFNPRNKQHVYKVLSDIARHINSLSNTSNIIIDYIFEDQEQLDHFLSSLDANHVHRHFYLQCNELEHRERILNRNREDVAWELERIVELRQIMGKSWNGNCRIIGTSSRSIDSVVSEILTKLS
jgi:broad-specificity NMP kinase